MHIRGVGQVILPALVSLILGSCGGMPSSSSVPTYADDIVVAPVVVRAMLAGYRLEFQPDIICVGVPIGGTGQVPLPNEVQEKLNALDARIRSIDKCASDDRIERPKNIRLMYKRTSEKPKYEYKGILTDEIDSVTQYAILYYDYCGTEKVMAGVNFLPPGGLGVSPDHVGQPRLSFFHSYAPPEPCVSK